MVAEHELDTLSVEQCPYARACGRVKVVQFGWKWLAQPCGKNAWRDRQPL
jgi:hypothetical protein